MKQYRFPPNWTPTQLAILREMIARQQSVEPRLVGEKPQES